MPSLIFAFTAIAAAVDPRIVSDVPIATQHAGDVIKYLWWGLGVLASFATFTSCGIAVWAIKTLLQHDKDIVEIKAECHMRHKDD